MRRRPRRRGLRRPPPPQQRGPRRIASRQLNPKLQRELKRANHLLQNGGHLNAAQIFLNLGENAQDKGILIPAAMLFTKAATAFLLANEIQNALEQSYRGLNLLAANQRWGAFQHQGEQLADAMQVNGFGSEAEELRSWIIEKSGKPAKNSAKAEKSAGKFPSKCPYCGAAMSLEQIKSSQHALTECKYCGSVVMAHQID